MREILQAPTYVDFDVTFRCNLKCEFCSSNAIYDNGNFPAITEQKENSELSLEEIDKIFSDFEYLGVFRVSIGGGEPFLRRDILDIIKLADKYSFSTIINTNAMLINDKIASELEKSKIDQIAISLDSCDSAIHNKMRGVSDAFDKALRGLKTMLKYNINITALLTLTSYNIDSVIPTLSFYKEIGLKNATIMLLCPTGRAKTNYTRVMYSYEKWKKLLLKLTEMKEKRELPVNLTIVPVNEGSIPWEIFLPLKEEGIEEKYKLWVQNREVINDDSYSCLAGINAASLAANGDIYGCDLMVAEKELCAGNIREESFEFIWNNAEIFKKLRNLKISENEGYCKICEIEGCGGGCRMSAFFLSNSITGADLRCELAKRNL